MFRQKYNQEDLIKGCLSNQRKWQERLYMSYFDTMYAMVFKNIKDQDTTLEIINIGFLKVFQKLDTYRNEGSFEGWIRRLIYNCMIDHFKSTKKYNTFIILGENDHETKSSENVADNIFFEELLGLLDFLPNVTGKVFKMYALDGYTHKEIAEHLGMSEGTSKWHLFEARAKLKKLVLENINYKKVE